MLAGQVPAMWPSLAAFARPEALRPAALRGRGLWGGGTDKTDTVDSELFGFPSPAALCGSSGATPTRNKAGHSWSSNAHCRDAQVARVPVSSEKCRSLLQGD